MAAWFNGSTTVLQAAATTNIDGTLLDVKGVSRLTVAVAITGTITVNFEGTLDDVTWFAVGLKTAADGVAVTTTAATGAWKRTPDLALSQFRARTSGVAGGTATVTAMKE